MHVLLTRAKVASLPLSADLSLVTRRSGSFGSFARACTATRAEIEMLALWPAEALSRCLVELCSAFYWCGVICAVLVDSGLTMPTVTASPRASIAAKVKLGESDIFATERCNNYFSKLSANISCITDIFLKDVLGHELQK